MRSYRGSAAAAATAASRCCLMICCRVCVICCTLWVDVAYCMQAGSPGGFGGGGSLAVAMIHATASFSPSPDLAEHACTQPPPLQSATGPEWYGTAPGTAQQASHHLGSTEVERRDCGSPRWDGAGQTPAKSPASARAGLIGPAHGACLGPESAISCPSGFPTPAPKPPERIKRTFVAFACLTKPQRRPVSCRTDSQQKSRRAVLTSPAAMAFTRSCLFASTINGIPFSASSSNSVLSSVLFSSCNREPHRARTAN